MASRTLVSYVKRGERRAGCAPIPTHADVIFQLDPSRGVELNLLQRLADDIVWLALALLGGLDRGGLVQVAFVVYVELAEGIREAEDLVLRELGELSGGGSQQPWMCNEAGAGRVEGRRRGGWASAHLWSLRTFMAAGGTGKVGELELGGVVRQGESLQPIPEAGWTGETCARKSSRARWLIGRRGSFGGEWRELSQVRDVEVGGKWDGWPDAAVLRRGGAG